MITMVSDVRLSAVPDGERQLQPSRCVPRGSRQKSASTLRGADQESGVARSWSGLDCRLADSLEEAVIFASQIARQGETVLFSPGTSSFDMFRNYGERGNRFKQAVNALE